MPGRFIDVKVDPARHWLSSEGAYTLVNGLDSALTRIPLTGGLHWKQLTWTMNGADYTPEDSQHLYLRWPDRPDEIVSAGGGWLGPLATGATRLPAGHPEGFIEAFANIYRDFAGAIRSATPIAATPLCGIEDGVRGLRFVDAALRSSAQGGTWQPVEDAGARP